MKTKYILLILLAIFLYYIAKNTTIKINVDFNSGFNKDSLLAPLAPILPSKEKEKKEEAVYIDSLHLYKIHYVQNSNELPIADNMVMSDTTEFNKYVNSYKSLIAQKFSAKQASPIREIIISNSAAFSDDNSDEALGGLCSTTDCGSKTYSSILVASKSPHHSLYLMHECCHALYYANLALFNSKYKDRWEKLNNQYVSDYAKTNIVEDFAETGAIYLIESHPSNCKEKLMLFEEFYAETK